MKSLRALFACLFFLWNVTAAPAQLIINELQGFSVSTSGGSALTTTSVDSANSVTSTATLVTSGTVTASVGDWLVVCVAADNNGTNGAVSLTGVQDSASNTWTQRALINYDPGAAAAGATLGIFTAPVTNAISSGTVTANFSPNTTAKAMRVFRVQPAAGETVTFIAADATGLTGTGTTHNANIVSVATNQTIFGCGAIESNTTMTADSDTTNGSWSASGTRTLAAGAGDATSMAVMHQFKSVTADGNQDWAQTTAASEDSARSYLVLGSS